MVSGRLSTRILALLLCGGLAPFFASAQPDDDPARTVRVSGEGTVRVAPDQAVVRFRVVTRAEHPETARRRNAEAASRAMNAVRELGVAEEKIRLETLRLSARQERDRDVDTTRTVGYEATRQVEVTLDSLDRLPGLVARVVQRGANRLDGIQYQLSNRTVARNGALREAARSARDKAQLLCETLSARLGSVRQIVEQTYSFEGPSPRVQMELASAPGDAESAPDAYAAGEIEVSAEVQVTFDLVPSE